MPQLPKRLRSLRRARIVARQLRAWWSPLEVTLARRLGLATREDRRFFLLIPLVGVLGGLLGIGVEYLIDGVRRLLWGGKGTLLALAESSPLWLVVLAP